MFDALIISDLHLGSDVCQAKSLLNFLDYARKSTKKLILNGDVFESIDMRRLKKHHWHVLSSLRKMSDEIEVIWISGNHDGPADIISQLLGIIVLPEYVLDSGLNKILILHGDRFDKFTTDRPILTWFGDMIYLYLQKINSNWARFAKRNSKTYLRCLDIVKEKSIKYAKSLDCDFVVCGHTHNACAEPPYFNSGCWTENPSTYLEVLNGEVKLSIFDSTLDGNKPEKNQEYFA